MIIGGSAKACFVPSRADIFREAAAKPRSGMTSRLNRSASLSNHSCFFRKPLFRLWSAMRAARPTTRSAHAFLKLCHRSPDVVLSRLGLLDDSDPTNPLVPRERCNVLPYHQRLGVRYQSFFRISRQIMDHTTGKFFGFTVLDTRLIATLRP